MGIPDLVRRHRDEEPEPPVELLNDDYPCECGVCGCNSPLVEPRHLRYG